MEDRLHFMAEMWNVSDKALQIKEIKMKSKSKSKSFRSKI